MAVRRAIIRVPFRPSAALSACRQALSPEVWELKEARDDGLVAHEWPWRLNCQIRPARLEIQATPATEEETTLRLEARAHGFGPVANRHLENHLRGLVERVRFSRD